MSRRHATRRCARSAVAPHREPGHERPAETTVDRPPPARSRRRAALLGAHGRADARAPLSPGWSGASSRRCGSRCVWAALLGALLAPWNARLSDATRWPAASSPPPDHARCDGAALRPAAGRDCGRGRRAGSQLLARLEQHVPDRAARTRSSTCRSVPMLARPLDWIGDHTGISLDQIAGLARRRAPRTCWRRSCSSGGAVVLGAVGTIVSFILMLFVLFFVLRDGPAFARQARRYAADRAAPPQRGSGSTCRTSRAPSSWASGSRRSRRAALVGDRLLDRAPAVAARVRRDRDALRADPVRRHDDRLGARRDLSRDRRAHSGTRSFLASGACWSWAPWTISCGHC